MEGDAMNGLVLGQSICSGGLLVGLLVYVWSVCTLLIRLNRTAAEKGGLEAANYLRKQRTFMRLSVLMILVSLVLSGIGLGIYFFFALAGY